MSAALKKDVALHSILEQTMKRINEYKKLFEVEGELELKALKSKYRSLVKEWHPDKFPADHPMAAEAESTSKKVIDAYHFLVGIAPETKANNLEAYTETTNSGIADFKHKGLLFEIEFIDGNTYEYFGVPKNIYIKICNSDKQVRFAKRNIFNSYLYRKVNKAAQPA